MPVPLVVTPEGVPLQFDTASAPTRILARLIDLALVAAVLVGILLVLGYASVGGGAGTVLTIAAYVLLPTCILGYPIACEQLFRGRTLGKLALGLRVVTREGAPVGFRHSLIRAGFDIVDVLSFSAAIGIVSMFVSKNDQRLGDMVAGTLVLRERSAARMPVPVAFQVPTGMEAYARTIDVSGLGPNDYAVVRSFLLRSGSMSGPTRGALAVQVAGPIVARLGQAPPAWVSPELFLLLVAANVQARARLADAVAPAGSGWGVAAAVPMAATAPAPAAATGFSLPG